ncbi:hypothetical protein FQA39_LY02038 [Lamprigera yunnana]|nr:hypothetical protein FQA39_LY02038 [Lamprigera yunnana]
MFNAAWISTVSNESKRRRILSHPRATQNFYVYDQKSRIVPFNRNSVPEEAIAPSRLTKNPVSEQSKKDRITVDNLITEVTVNKLLEIPSAAASIDVVIPKRKKRDYSAKCLNQLQGGASTSLQRDMEEPGCSKEQQKKGTKSSRPNKRSKKDDDWECGVLRRKF